MGTCASEIPDECKRFHCRYPGFFRHPRNCQYYVACPDKGSGQTSDALRTLHKCPDGYYYEKQEQSDHRTACVLAHSADTCKFQAIIPPPENLAKDAECTDVGVYSSSHSPRGFRMCERQHHKHHNYASQKELCPKGMHFDRNVCSI